MSGMHASGQARGPDPAGDFYMKMCVGGKSLDFNILKFRRDAVHVFDF
jgi:hypothetical protein